ncbi:hypothetical protein FM996_14420 [Methylosinus sporium]|uniref:Uncharacterized protein n=1 Tax=Methylosinus sporium TaxID=428 RepID=A0A549SNG7_METSR|nr:hypothetical protein FM996_14420 [Methylosinus sporium]
MRAFSSSSFRFSNSFICRITRFDASRSSDARISLMSQFAAYWKETNSSPMLQPFLDLLRARYPDLSVSATSG